MKFAQIFEAIQDDFEDIFTLLNLAYSGGVMAAAGPSKTHGKVLSQ